MTTRRQHYVWRKYLEPWTTRKGKAHQIWCLRREGTAPINPEVKNVAVQRDFYRLRDLERGDVEFVRAMGISKDTSAPARKTNERWIAIFEGMLKLQRVLCDRLSANSQLLAELDKEIIESQENDYARIEGRAVPHLIALQGGDVTFFEDDTEAIKFSYFLAHQYFRTKAMRDRIRDTYSAQADKDRFDRTWPILRYIYATNIGCDIFRNRRSVKLQVLEAGPGMEFITSDQPAINTYGAFVPSRTPIAEVELFVRAFVRLRDLLASNTALARKLDELERKYQHHDDAIKAILSAIRELMNPPQPKRRPIGFTADLSKKS